MPVKSKKLIKPSPTLELRAAKAANKLLVEALERTRELLTTAHDAHEATRLAHSETLKKLEATEAHNAALLRGEIGKALECTYCGVQGKRGSGINVCDGAECTERHFRERGLPPTKFHGWRCKIKQHFRKCGMEYLLIALICGAAAVFVWFAATAK